MRIQDILFEGEKRLTACQGSLTQDGLSDHRSLKCFTDTIKGSLNDLYPTIRVLQENKNDETLWKDETLLTMLREYGTLSVLLNRIEVYLGRYENLQA